MLRCGACNFSGKLQMEISEIIAVIIVVGVGKIVGNIDTQGCNECEMASSEVGREEQPTEKAGGWAHNITICACKTGSSCS